MIYQISTITLTFNVAEDVDRVAPAFSDWLSERKFAPLKDMTSNIGGFHAPRCLTYGTSCNWFKEADFVDYFSEFDWLFPENAALLVHTENRATNLYRPSF